MNYFIIAEEFRVGVLGKGGIPKFATSWEEITIPPELPGDPPIHYKFVTSEDAQKYIDEEKPEGKNWVIFFIENDDYANF